MPLVSPVVAQQECLPYVRALSRSKDQPLDNGANHAVEFAVDMCLRYMIHTWLVPDKNVSVGCV